MKKLLLAALLAVGATSFGAISTNINGKTGSVTLPVTVKGTVNTDTTATLVVTCTTPGSINPDSMDFVFENLFVGAKTPSIATGTYKVELVHGQTMGGVWGQKPSVKLVKGDLEQSGNVVEVAKGDIENKADLRFTLGPLVEKSEKLFTGSLDVEATAGSTTGNFAYNEMGIKVTAQAR